MLGPSPIIAGHLQFCPAILQFPVTEVVSAIRAEIFIATDLNTAELTSIALNVYLTKEQQEI